MLQICTKRISVEEYASQKCQVFAQLVSGLTSKGTQVHHDKGKPNLLYFCFIKLTPPSLSELTPIVFNMKLTLLGSDTSKL